MFPQFEFPGYKPLLFSLSNFSVSKTKGDLSGKIFIQNQLAIKTDQPTDS